jgi:prepilin-type N-terminal cleavage/methylation domain-containing protein
VKAFLGRRDGMTLLEVLLTLAIFLVGSVGIIGLFVAASVLHSDAVGRRTASYIAETLLANVQAKPLHEVFAKTTVVADGGASIQVQAVKADPPDPIAAFDEWPLGTTARDEGFLLLQGSASAVPAVPDELVYYSQAPTVGTPGTFSLVTRNVTVGGTGTHPVGVGVLQPRTWDYVLNGGMTGPNITAISVYGNPLTEPPLIGSTPAGAPATGYFVIDKEWIRYSARDATGFTIYNDPNTAAVDGRGWGLTTLADHKAGAPVTVAQEYPGYPGFYYTIQYYPVNATGAEARVIVMVGFGTEKRFHVEAFEGVYTPSQY